MSSATELSCPNCGAPYALPEFDAQIECAYCGTRLILPEAVRQNDAPEIFAAPQISLDLSRMQTDTMRWVKWLVIFIIVVTVVPTVCGIFASVCGSFAGVLAMFFH